MIHIPLKIIDKTILIIVFIVFPACNKGEKSNDSLQPIDIQSNVDNMEILNLSDFTNDIEYVSLETQENLSLTYISQIDFIGDFILVTDMNVCLLYNKEGHFISEIGSQGRGPGEYEFVSEMNFVSPKVIAIQSIYDLLEFNTDGYLINKGKNGFMLNNNEDEYLRSWLIIKDSLFFGHVPNTTGQIENKALIINKHGSINQAYKNYIKFDRERTVASYFEDYAHIYHFQNSIYYKEFYNDTLFYLTNDYRLVPRYAFNLGKYKEPITERAKQLQGPSMPRYIYIWNVFQTEKYLFLNCRFGDHFPAKRITPKSIMGTITTMYNTVNALGIFNKKTKELVFCKPTSTDNPLFTSGLYNDIDAGPRFFPIKQVNDSTMVMWINPDELKDHIESDDFRNTFPKYPTKKKQLEDFSNSLSVFDNPVLMFVTFKK